MTDYCVRRWAISTGEGFIGPGWWFGGKPPSGRGVTYPWPVGVELFMTRKEARAALCSVKPYFADAKVVAVRVNVEEVVH